MYQARCYDFGDGPKWVVEHFMDTIVGVPAWFIVCEVPESDESSMGYTDGEHGTAEERAKQIVEALNKNG